MHNSRLCVDESEKYFMDLRRFINTFQEPFEFGAVIVLDIDDFIFFNDKFGYQIGNLLIDEINKFLCSITKSEFVFRYGGDKFAVLMQNCTKQYANMVARQIFKRFSNSFMIHNEPYICTVSIGIVYYPEHAKDIEELLNAMDFVLYDAKSSGKNRIVVYNKSNMIFIKRRYTIERVLKQALVQKKFRIFYQPVYDISKNKFLKVEALLRLFDDELKNISPAEFIPAAERLGLICDIGYFVIEQVFKDINWLQKNDYPFESISINISIVQFFDQDFVKRLNSLIKKYQISPPMIEFEILESVFITSFDQIRSVIDALSELGIKLSIDDFGTGFSSLSYVLNLPITTLKLDKSLSGQLNSQNCILLKYLISMSHELNIKVVAEGIEYPHQVSFFKSCDCDYVQGFLFSKPVPLKEAAAFLGKSPDFSIL